MSGLDKAHWLPGEDLAYLASRSHPPVRPVPVRAEYSVTCCDRCSATLAVPVGGIGDWCQGNYAGTVNGEPAFPVGYCPKCRKIVDKEEQARPVVPGMQCVHRAYQSGPFSYLYVVTAESRDYTVTLDGTEYPVAVPPLVHVGVLGLGGTSAERQDEILARWWPPEMRGQRAFPRPYLMMKGM